MGAQPLRWGMLQTIDQQPDEAATPSTVIENLETNALATAKQAAVDSVNIVAPWGPMPYDPSDPNFNGLPNPTGITTRLSQQRTQQNNFGLLLVLVLLWKFL